MALDALVLRGLRADDERHSGLPLDLITGTGAARGVYTVVWEEVAVRSAVIY